MSSFADDTSPLSTPPSSLSEQENGSKAELVVEDSISENPFDNESSRILFDAVDQLQHCGASRHVAIPQLVIVGGQSTGKSSLLRSLTDIPFPVGTGCCTRFATRIVSKRTAPGTPNQFKITIVEPEVKVEGFVYPPNNDYEDYVHMGETLTADEFETVMNEVSANHMGIRSGKGPDKKNFATQVLRVELSGPARSYFSIVDIPGLFVNPNTVNEGEMHGIQSMIIEYMKKPENLVICVADAVTDVANQGIVHLASLHVSKERCVGVLTKCDMLRDDEETSRKIVNIATGREEHTTKPICDTWFVVRNRSSKEDRSFDLAHAEKQLFETAPWDEIDSGRRGTSMLRKHLSYLLSQGIRGNFPDIRARIQELLANAQKSRAALGDARPTHTDRLKYLREIIERYETHAAHALESPGSLDEQLRARNIVKVSNVEFAKLMLERGHTYQFEDPDMDPLAEVLRMKDEFPDNLFFSQGHSRPPSTPQKHQSFPSGRTPTKIPAKDEIGKDLREEIRRELRAFEGTQLFGLINPQVIPTLYRKQTQNWHKYAHQHIFTVANHVAVAAKGILELVCPADPISGNPRLHNGLLNVLQEFYEKSGQATLRELEKYSDRVSSHLLQTENPKYYERLKAWQTIRLLRSLASVSPDSDATAIYDRLHYTMEDNMVDAVHDILKVYYQISIEAYTRHVTHIIVENLVSGTNPEKGPLKGLSRDWVYSLGEDEVERLTREDETTIAKRAELDKQINELQTADSIARNATEATSNLS
ncbi:vacuolar sorting protein VPS1 [Xylaria bambusicola]|uniref:vacuolar sorting protein VPS1 n=1 Tax=Xylaria bambusicola TaxID=326684 RepID=UPI002008A636|nr:vacuolar sorting protein VPS1 [Xylaria bambusicola]KAI0526190.1 vacuolar sorting protein VPS1 [Xylaria bambusicola]